MQKRCFSYQSIELKNSCGEVDPSSFVCFALGWIIFVELPLEAGKKLFLLLIRI
jgi:hypothetical protein